jgi:hypothetical protein
VGAARLWRAPKRATPPPLPPLQPASAAAGQASGVSPLAEADLRAAFGTEVKLKTAKEKVKFTGVTQKSQVDQQFDCKSL